MKQEQLYDLISANAEISTEKNIKDFLFDLCAKNEQWADLVNQKSNIKIHLDSSDGKLFVVFVDTYNQKTNKTSHYCMYVDDVNFIIRELKDHINPLEKNKYLGNANDEWMCFLLNEHKQKYAKFLNDYSKEQMANEIIRYQKIVQTFNKDMKYERQQFNKNIATWKKAKDLANEILKEKTKQEEPKL